MFSRKNKGVLYVSMQYVPTVQESAWDHRHEGAALLGSWKGHQNIRPLWMIWVSDPAFASQKQTLVSNEMKGSILYWVTS